MTGSAKGSGENVADGEREEEALWALLLRPNTSMAWSSSRQISWPESCKELLKELLYEELLNKELNSTLLI